jgi:hypothetical protein
VILLQTKVANTHTLQIPFLLKTKITNKNIFQTPLLLQIESASKHEQEEKITRKKR